MASQRSPDFIPLAEEQFDFDISLSPSSGEEEGEDEVFLGPIRHKEKCISVGIETHVRKDTSSGHSLGEEPSWSPLAECKFMEISKEAHLLAQQIEMSTSVKPAAAGDSSQTADDRQLPRENFVEDSREKLGLFGKADPVLSPIKRETFCVRDSPMKQLPPAIQHRLLKAGRTASPTASTSSPVKTCKAPPKSTLRMKAAVPQAGVLPSKLAAPARASLSMRTKPPPSDKSRLAPLEKAKRGLQRSPRGRPLSGASSSEDLLSDTASVASDVSDCSINIGQPAKRSFPALRKSGHQRQAPMKAQALYCKPDDGRKTSSSSSSVSSLNSSLSASPMGKGKLNTSLNSSLNGTRARVPSGVNRLLSSGVLGRGRPSSVVARKPAEVRPQQIKATPVKKLENTPQHQMPRRISERSASLPSIPGASTRTSSAIKVDAKRKSIVPPTPTSQFKGPQRSEVPDPSKTVNPRKLMLAYSLESLDQKSGAVEVPQTPGSLGPTQSKLRRASALPTPVNRRVSGIPMLTPKSLTRPGRLSQASEMEKLPTSAGRVSRESPVPQMQRMSSQEPERLPSKEASDSAQLQPYSLSFSLEDDTEETPGAVPIPDSPECTSKPTAECPSEVTPQNTDPAGPEGTRELPQDCAEKMPESNEVLLVDAPAPGLKMEERLLIDLSNTPELIKMAPVKPIGGQLIDLSSPLITWSPADRKENVVESAPLINLSF